MNKKQITFLFLFFFHFLLFSQTWTQLPDFPSTERDDGTCFIIGDTAFCGTGLKTGFVHYLIFGKDAGNHYSNELYAFDPVTNKWTYLHTFPDKGRTYAAMKAISNDLFVIAGIDSLNNSHNDLWRYNLLSSKWQQLSPIPAAGRRGGMCFNSGTTIYYTTGIDQTHNRIRETWKIMNPTSIAEYHWSSQVKVFPNPVTDQLTILTQTHEFLCESITVRNTLGQILLEQRVFGPAGMDVHLLPSGVYLLELHGRQGVAVKKFVKE